MVTPFEVVWEYVDKIPGSFTRINAEKYYEYALQAEGNVVEIGVDQGRSASVLMFAAKHTGASITLVDSWKSVLRANRDKVSDRLHADFPDLKWTICHADSVNAASLVNEEIRFSLIHIDGDHWGTGPEDDCVAWLPKLLPGGIVCVHDFRVETMGDAVDKAVDKYTAGWEDLGAWEGLGIRRKPL